MTKEANTQQKNTNTKDAPKNANKRGGRFGRGDNRRRGNRHAPQNDFEQKILDLARVTRVTRGGKRMRFRACVVISDKKGKLGVGLAKGADVTDSINKAVLQAKKSMLDLSPLKGKLPHECFAKFGSARVMLKPGKNGNGIIAGGVVRVMLELSGINDVVAKMSGGKNKINNARALMEGFRFIVDNNRKK